PERVEPARLRSGRVDCIVRFAKPGVADRTASARLCCRRIPLASDVDVADLARRMDGSTGADIESVCKKATLLAVADFQAGRRGTQFVVNRNDFEAVMSTVSDVEGGL